MVWDTEANGKMEPTVTSIIPYSNRSVSRCSPKDCDDCLYQNNWTTAEKLTVPWVFRFRWDVMCIYPPCIKCVT